MVLISRLICATETPSTAGAMSLSTRCTPSSRQTGSKRGTMPILASAGSWIASCSTPPRTTAQARARTGGSNQGAANSAMPMKDRFSSTGVNAGRANRLHVLRTPAASATSDMNSM